MKRQLAGYMVFYDDSGGLCVPFGIDPDTEGAIQVCREPLLFATRKDAQRAIAISTAAAKLAIAQGKPANTDFTEGKQYVTIRKVWASEQAT